MQRRGDNGNIRLKDGNWKLEASGEDFSVEGALLC
jgi:hypothetical protein